MSQVGGCALVLGWAIHSSQDAVSLMAPAEAVFPSSPKTALFRQVSYSEM